MGKNSNKKERGGEDHRHPDIEAHRDDEQSWRHIQDTFEGQTKENRTRTTSLRGGFASGRADLYSLDASRGPRRETRLVPA